MDAMDAMETNNSNTENKPLESKSQTEKPDESNPLIDYEAFSKVQLRVGKIIAAEKVPKSEKLLKMQVNLGEKLGVRQVLGGIAKYYETESLIGKNIIVVANLKPAKLMGLESQGMLLAASNDAGTLELLSVKEELEPGSIVK